MIDPFDRISDQDYNILSYFLQTSGIRVPRKTVHALQDDVTDGGPMSLGVMARVLNQLSLQYTAARFHDVKEMAAGGVALVSLKDSGRSLHGPALHSFAVMIGLDRDGAPMLRNAHGESILLSPSAWRRRWNHVAIQLTVSKVTPTSADMALQTQEEAIGANAYLNRVRFAEGVVDDQFCDTIVRECERQRLFRRSRVSTRNIVSGHRTSFTGYLTPQFAEPVIARLREFPELRSAEFEPVQIVRYRPHQEFRAHIDVARNLSRSTTILLYLNDNFAGGGTIFPRLERSWSAKKGAVLIFPNLDEEGQPIEWSLHCGQRVDAGTKYVCNVWIR